jgi:hypothetical protein
MILMPSTAKMSKDPVDSCLGRGRGIGPRAAWLASSIQILRASWVTQSAAGLAVIPAIPASRLDPWTSVNRNVTVPNGHPRPSLHGHPAHRSRA